jgi:hypothetical protein
LFCKFSEQLEDIGDFNTEVIGIQVDKNTACHPVQVAHQRYLLRPFLPIFLIDAYGVNPEVSGLVFKSQSVQGVPAVQSYFQGRVLRLWDGPMVETEDGSPVARETPHVG